MAQQMVKTGKFNLREWLQQNRLSSLYGKMNSEELQLQELFALTDSELSDYVQITLNVGDIVKCRRFILALRLLQSTHPVIIGLPLPALGGASSPLPSSAIVAGVPNPNTRGAPLKIDDEKTRPHDVPPTTPHFFSEDEKTPLPVPTHRVKPALSSEERGAIKELNLCEKRLKKKLDRYSQSASDLHESHLSGIERIRQSFGALRGLLNAREKTLIGQWNELKSSKMKKVVSENSNLRRCLRNIAESQRAIDALVMGDDTDDIDESPSSTSHKGGMRLSLSPYQRRLEVVKLVKDALCRQKKEGAHSNEESDIDGKIKVMLDEDELKGMVKNYGQLIGRVIEPPSVCQIKSMTHDSVTIEWLENEKEDDDDGEAFEFEMRVAEERDVEWRVIKNDQLESKGRHTLKKLMESSKYLVKIRRRGTDTDWSSYSPIISVFTPARPRPPLSPPTASASASPMAVLKQGMAMSVDRYRHLSWLAKEIALRFSKKESELKSTLLFRASRDGFSANAFHDKCDKKGPTFTLIESEFGHIFGGFTKVPWSKNGGKRRDPSCFLFLLHAKQSILKKYDMCTPFAFPIHPGEVDRAVYHAPDSGAGFGYQCTLRIMDKCDSDARSWVLFPDSFICKNWRVGAEDKCDLISGHPAGGTHCNFKVIDYQVFLVA